MNAASSSESLLEELHRVRDQRSEAVHVMQHSNPDEIVAALSSLRMVSLHLLRNYTEFVELLEVKTRASVATMRTCNNDDAGPPNEQTARRNRQQRRPGAGNIADLRNEQLEHPRYT